MILDENLVWAGAILKHPSHGFVRAGFGCMRGVENGAQHGKEKVDIEGLALGPQVNELDKRGVKTSSLGGWVPGFKASPSKSIANP